MFCKAFSRGSRQTGKEDNVADKSTQPRLDIKKVNPDLFNAMLGFEKYVQSSGLGQKLQDLVKIRASQINGCAYCIVMHTNDARKHGESDEWMIGSSLDTPPKADIRSAHRDFRFRPQGDIAPRPHTSSESVVRQASATFALRKAYNYPSVRREFYNSEMKSLAALCAFCALSANPLFRATD
jgi:AhpD family alkylhydroperoxidase